MINRKVKTFFILLIKFCSLIAQERYDVNYPLINTLNYPFMDSIASYIINTKHEVIYPNSQISLERDCIYFMDICSNSYQRNDLNSSWNNFDKNATCKIEITHIVWPRISPYTSLFMVKGLCFCTDSTLYPYFNSCSTEKKHFVFKYPYVPSCIFWFFVVSNGEVVNAYYYYEPDEWEIEANPAYDLITKKMVTYGYLRKKFNF